MPPEEQPILPPPPQQKTTVEFEKPPAWAIELSQRMNDEFKELRADIGTLMEDSKSTRERMMRAEKRQDEFEEWRARASERAKAPSSADLENASQLVLEREARQKLAAKVDDIAAGHEALRAETAQQTVMLQKLTALASNPLLQKVATALGTAILTWLTMKGLR